jgi:hypothetical protein
VKQDDFVNKIDPAYMQITIVKYVKQLIGANFYLVETIVPAPWDMVVETKITYL